MHGNEREKINRLFLFLISDSSPPGGFSMFAASTALKIHGDHPAENMFQLGLGRFLHGDYQQAATHITAALKHDPANPIFYCQRGEVFRLLCDYERAIADFTSALRLEP